MFFAWLKIANRFQTKFDSYLMFCRNIDWVGSGCWSNTQWVSGVGDITSFSSELSVALAFIFLSTCMAFRGRIYCSGSADKRPQKTDTGLP